MKNTLDDRPDMDLHGRLRYSKDAVAERDVRGRDVLDIGCGFGWFTQWALGHGARTVVGIEHRAQNLETVRRHIDDPRVEFHVASAIALPFKSESIDTAVMWEVLEHLPRDTESATFKEIGRVLRPGGVLHLSTPHSSSVARATDPAWWLIGHRHYSRPRLQEFAESAGLDTEHIELKGGWWEILHMNNMYLSKWILRRRPILQRPLLSRVDREWNESTGFTHVVLRCRKRVN